MNKCCRFQINNISRFKFLRTFCLALFIRFDEKLEQKYFPCAVWWMKCHHEKQDKLNCKLINFIFVIRRPNQTVGTYFTSA